MLAKGLAFPMPAFVRILGCLAVALPLAAGAQTDYIGVLKPPRNAAPFPLGAYSFSNPLFGAAPAFTPDNGQRLTLGYKYSRYFSVEGDFVDPGRPAPDLFGPASALGSAFRTPGFGVDTIATLPVWRFSFYGKLGAFRGDNPRNVMPTVSPSVLADPLRGTRWRAGLGMRYDFTSSLGIRAEFERQTPFSTPFSPEQDADQFSVGVSWRF